MRQPCDEGVVLSGKPAPPCGPKAQPWILAATILASSMAFIDSTVVNVALPALQSSLQATVVDVQWVVESYGLFLSALILSGGALGDAFGRRLMFLLGFGLFASASMACGVSVNIGQLVIARSIQGIGAAFLVPGSLAIISASFDEKSRGKAIGTWSGFTAITTASGPVLGGWLIEHASWHWIFFINVPLAVAVVAISLWQIPESRSRLSTHVDWLGGRPGFALWLPASAARRAADRCRRVCSARGALRWDQLLGDVFPCVHCARLRYGGQRGAFDHCRDEFRRTRSCWNRLWDQQCGGKSRGSSGRRRPGVGDGRCVQI